MKNDKYKLFRNYMANELGITKEDIKQWCIETVQEEIKKQLGQLNINQILKTTVQHYIEGSFMRDPLCNDVAKLLADKIILSLKE